MGTRPRPQLRPAAGVRQFQAREARKTSRPADRQALGTRRLSWPADRGDILKVIAEGRDQPAEEAAPEEGSP